MLWLLIGLIIFFSLFGIFMWNVFINDTEYKYNPNEYEGEYLVTGEEWDIKEEVEERQKALQSSWIIQDSAPTQIWEEDFVEEGPTEATTESEEHY